jgi:hypothetical protein
LEQESRREGKKEARGGFRCDRDQDTGDEGRALEDEGLAPVERNEGRGGTREAGARERREVPFGSVTRDGIEVGGSRDGVAIEHAESDPEGEIWGEDIDASSGGVIEELEGKLTGLTGPVERTDFGDEMRIERVTTTDGGEGIPFRIGETRCWGCGRDAVEVAELNEIAVPNRIPSSVERSDSTGVIEGVVERKDVNRCLLTPSWDGKG